MKCRECEVVTPIDFLTGICESCKEKLKTCTVCGKQMDTIGSAYIKVEKGQQVARGHYECISGDSEVKPNGSG